MERLSRRRRARGLGKPARLDPRPPRRGDARGAIDQPGAGRGMGVGRAPAPAVAGRRGLSYSMPMSMTSFTFDRLTYIDRLTAAGFEERQARAHAEALDAALHESVATKGDLKDLGQELRQELRKEIADVRLEITRLEAKLEASAANLKVDILRWLIVTQLALAGFVLAAIKFVK